MGKVLVLYHSASGNTATMARLVAEGAGVIPDTDVRLRELDAAARHLRSRHSRSRRAFVMQSSRERLLVVDAAVAHFLH